MTGAQPFELDELPGEPDTDPLDIMGLTRELCGYVSGVVAPENEKIFSRIGQEVSLNVLRFQSGDSHNGWLVPNNWYVEKAEIRKDGRLVFDGLVHPLAVALYAKSFTGRLDLSELKEHIVTDPNRPLAHIFHCQWQVRSWAADWAFSMPYNIYENLEDGEYDVELVTRYEPGEMLVGVCDIAGRSDKTILFNTNTCHPTQADDGFCAVSLLIRIFQWLKTRNTYYSYRLIVAPEHLGSVFYLRDHPVDEVNRIVSGVFAEMPGNEAPVCVTSTFLGGQKLDRAFANAVRHCCRNGRTSDWRNGVGNDETVWESPGYEIPTAEITRSHNPNEPYPEYHSSLDNPDLMDLEQVYEFYEILRKVINTLENDARMYRKFDGLICLSNPEYDLYFERHDPAIDKNLSVDDEKWGHLLDYLFRYFDGSMSVLDIAEKHELPFDALLKYIRRFEKRGLVDLEFSEITRPPARFMANGPRLRPSDATGALHNV